MNKLNLTAFILIALMGASPAYAEDAAPSKKVAPVVVKTDKEGNITQEAAKALAEKQFGLYDRDRDGSFDMKDYRGPFEVLAKQKKINLKAGSADEKAITESFARMDKNKDGKVGKPEFLKDAEIRHKAMDANNDGVVSPKEVDTLKKKIEAAHKKAVQ